MAYLKAKGGKIVKLNLWGLSCLSFMLLATNPAGQGQSLKTNGKSGIHLAQSSFESVINRKQLR